MNDMQEKNNGKEEIGKSRSKRSLSICNSRGHAKMKRRKEHEKEEKEEEDEEEEDLPSRKRQA